MDQLSSAAYSRGRRDRRAASGNTASHDDLA